METFSNESMKYDFRFFTKFSLQYNSNNHYDFYFLSTMYFLQIRIISPFSLAPYKL